jgi:hypothetical protein
MLWRLAGGRPPASTPERSADPAGDLGAALELVLVPRERRRGAHYTPAWLADEVARRALPLPAATEMTVCDPACGAGAVLLAAGRRLAAAGHRPAHVARELLWGADIDPLAAAVTEAAIALWSGGTGPAAGHVVAGDPLTDGAGAWPAPVPGGFAAVAGNPPFQGQLATETSRSRAEAAVLRARFGTAAAPYVDTAALFLLLGAELVRRGGRVALVQPASVAAARDTAGVRAALADVAGLVELWTPPGRAFAAAVRVCVPVLEVGRPSGASWAGELAAAEGVPQVDLPQERSLASMALTVGSFRDEYYGLVPHVREADGPAVSPLVTSGLIDLGGTSWGERPARFAKRTWLRPVVDLESLERAGGRAWSHVARLRCPKILVANQTRVVEAAPDLTGAWVPSTPVVSVVPRDRSGLLALTAVLSAPPVTAWLATAGAGTGLADGTFRVTARLLQRLPLPDDDSAWRAGAVALERWIGGTGQMEDWAGPLTAAFGVRGAAADELLAWWAGRIPAGR